MPVCKWIVVVVVAPWLSGVAFQKEEDEEEEEAIPHNITIFEPLCAAIHRLCTQKEEEKGALLYIVPCTTILTQ